MDVRILLYNVNRRKLTSLVVDLVHENDIDIAILVEPDDRPMDLLRSLNADSASFYYNVDTCTHINIFSKFQGRMFELIKAFDRTTGWRLKTPLSEIVIIATHYFDKFYNDPIAQKTKIPRLKKEIEEIEKLTSTEKVILTGDLNLDPYDEPCFMPYGLNAIMCRKTVSRIRQREGQKMFYNPSWNLLGDRLHTPGTYYRASPGNQYWSVLDQVMLRPDAIDNFDLDSLKTINHTSKHTLLSKNDIPDKKQYSDHLPITFTIQLP